MKSKMAETCAARTLQRCQMVTFQHCNLLTFLLLSVISSGAATLPPLLNDPEVFGPAMAKRSQNQIQASKSWPIFHDFSFTDRLSESGIHFQHQAVDDAGKHYKPVHYD